MKFSDFIKISISSLSGHPLRSLLAILGVVIGVAAVIAVVAFGAGHRQRIQNEIDKMGADVFWIQSQRPIFDISDDIKEKIQLQMQFLKFTDLHAIKRHLTRINRVAGYTSFHTLIFVDKQEFQSNMIATEPAFKEIGKLEIMSGRFLSDLDLLLARKVCIIEYNENIKKTIAAIEPFKNYVYIDNSRFTIIGLLKKNTEFPGSGFSAKIYLPLTTMKDLNYGDHIDRIYCQASQKVVNIAMQHTETLLRSRYCGESLFEAMNAKKMFQSAERLTRTASLVTAGIAMISLLVGGIGIMNIMMVSVTERIGEIGMRKAVGAKKRDLRNQFLVETILLTFIGGMVGIGTGIFLAKVIGMIIQIPVVISIVSIITGVFFSVFIGVISGLYPALKASKMDPIEALRYE